MSLHDEQELGPPEYTDPEGYDAENKWGADDDFYLDLAKKIGGPVLDVGCGTGRLTLEIARAGLDTTGLDISPHMLNHARKKAREQGLDIEWVLGDARRMQLERKFRLILMTSHGFQYMLTDQDISDFLSRMREHLLDDGYLAFETRNYAAKDYGNSEELTLWRNAQDDEGRWFDVLVAGRLDPDTGIEFLTFERVVRDTGERERETSVMRYVTVEELNRMLREHGFEVVEQYGDWDRSPTGEDQPEIITICRLSA